MLSNKISVLAAALVLLSLSSAPVRAADLALGFALSGVVEKVLVKPGQAVASGQALVVLDTTTIRARSKAVEAEITASQGVAALAERRFQSAQEQFAAVSLSKVELDTARIERDEARARLAKAQARLAVLQWRLDRSTLKASGKGRVKSVNTWPGMVINLRSENPSIVVISVP